MVVRMRWHLFVIAAACLSRAFAQKLPMASLAALRSICIDQCEVVRISNSIVHKVFFLEYPGSGGKRLGHRSAPAPGCRGDWYRGVEADLGGPRSEHPRSRERKGRSVGPVVARSFQVRLWNGVHLVRQFITSHLIIHHDVGCSL